MAVKICEERNENVAINCLGHQGFRDKELADKIYHSILGKGFRVLKFPHQAGN